MCYVFAVLCGASMSEPEAVKRYKSNANAPAPQKVGARLRTDIAEALAR